MIKDNFNGGLNLDYSLYKVRKNEYVDGLNISRDSIEGSNDHAITNVVGNRIVDNPYLVLSHFNANYSTTLIVINNLDGTFKLIINFSGLPGDATDVILTYTDGVTPVNTSVGTTSPQTITIPSGVYAYSFSVVTPGGTIEYPLPFSPGSNICIGAYPNTYRNTVICMFFNISAYHLVCEYNNTSKSFAPIFRNLIDSSEDILGFTLNSKITGINIYPREEGDLLFFLDSLRRPTYMDIARFKAREYVPVTREIIDVARRPPLGQPTSVYYNDLTKLTNSLRNKLFRFKYLFIYDNNEESTCSPISEIPYPPNIIDDSFTSIITNNNAISITLNSGGKNVKSIQLLMSFSSITNLWEDFAIVDTIDKSSILFKVSFFVTNFSPVAVKSVNASFSGFLTDGTIINVFLSPVGGGADVLAGTYTTIISDTINSSLLALRLSLIALGVITPVVIVTGTTIVFSWNSSLYNFGSFQIIHGTADTDFLYFPYSFFNDGTYPLKDINQSNLLFDAIPFSAEDQNMPNGDTLSYHNITEGYDRDLVPEVVNFVQTRLSSTSNPVGTISVVNQDLGILFVGAREYQITFSGTPVAGTYISIQVKRLSDSAILSAANYTTLVGDTSAQVYTGMFVSKNNINILGDSTANPYTSFKYLNFYDDYEFLEVIVTVPSTVATHNSIPTFPFSTERQIGLAYFDANGVTNGILYNATLQFPQYAEDITGAVALPYIKSRIYHQPPIWAYSYSWYLTKEATQYLYWVSIDILVEIGTYMYFNISNLELNPVKFPTTTQTLAWHFEDGDRMRVIKVIPGNTFLSVDFDIAMEGFVKDPKVNGADQTGLFAKIKHVAPFTGINPALKTYVIQFYRPSQQNPNSKNEVFYEFGQQYFILEPGTSLRSHQGMVTNQDIPNNIPAEFNFYNGDAYFRNRTIVLTESGAATYNCIDRNFVDTYISAVNNIDGRPNIIDLNAKRATYPATIRFGQAYQANTNINGLNRFYPNNLLDVDITQGGIKRSVVRDRFMRIFQEFKVGMIPIFSQINKQPDGTTVNVVTDNLLNPVQYYEGNWGIGSNAESLSSFDFADFFTTNIKGSICRVSNNGVESISVIHNVNSWATEHLPSRKGTYKVYGAFDQRLGNYIIALEATDTDEAYTLVYDTEMASFETFYSYHPEMMVTLGVLLISFKNGGLYTHDSSIYNNFYNQQYDSHITPVFNESQFDKKTFESICEIASDVWDCPFIQTDVNSYNNTKQITKLVSSEFKNLEGSFEAALRRDINSIKGIINGDTMKGKIMIVRFRKEGASSLVSLNLVSLKYINSPLNVR